MPPADELPPAIEDAWADFRRSLARRGRKPGTVDVYRKSFLNFWRWALSTGLPADPSAVDYRTINAWTDHLLEVPTMRNGRPVMVRDPDTGEHVAKLLEPATRRILYANLRPFFSWWSKEEGVDNPFDRSDSPTGDKDAPVPLVSLDDVRAVIATCVDRSDFTDCRDLAILRTMIDTGARRGELTALRSADWDRRNDLLLLDGKSGPRTVPLSLSTGEAMSRYFRRRSEHRYAKLPAMWLGPKGALGDSGIAQMLNRRCDLAGVPHINPHRFRHTWAHLFRAEGGAEGDLMYLAGWSSTEMAHRYGRSAAMERAQDAARRIHIGDRV
ncbi:MAG TPA: tyrosine-type recombinase/integrase [Aquihabitans sp.]|nr:tyrosine-type recombinase/integrase [Aquihabitans sp.]